MKINELEKGDSFKVRNRKLGELSEQVIQFEHVNGYYCVCSLGGKRIHLASNTCIEKIEREV